MQTIPYQRCPICGGSGSIINYDMSSAVVSTVCKTCNGAGIIPEYVIPQETLTTTYSPNEFTEAQVREAIELASYFSQEEMLDNMTADEIIQKIKEGK